jgi:hypothetical protein
MISPLPCLVCSMVMTTTETWRELRDYKWMAHGPSPLVSAPDEPAKDSQESRMAGNFVAWICGVLL